MRRTDLHADGSSSRENCGVIISIDVVEALACNQGFGVFLGLANVLTLDNDGGPKFLLEEQKRCKR